MAELMNEASGSKYPNLDIKEYKLGTMTEVVYPCYGPYEDFVYAGSWDSKNLKICTPEIEPGYPAERQQYGDDVLRGFVFLVEAGKHKIPEDRDFGRADVWDNQGHVNRNIMLSMVLSEFTAPKISIEDIEVSEGKIKLWYEVKGCFEPDFARYRVSEPRGGSNLGEKIFLDEKVDISKFKTKGVLEVDTSNLRSEGVKEVSLILEMSCDRKWGNEGKAQSHFVKLRTLQNYTANNSGYTLNSFEKFSIEIENLNIEKNTQKGDFLIFASSKKNTSGERRKVLFIPKKSKMLINGHISIMKNLKAEAQILDIKENTVFLDFKMFDEQKNLKENFPIKMHKSQLLDSPGSFLEIRNKNSFVSMIGIAILDFNLKNEFLTFGDHNSNLYALLRSEKRGINIQIFIKNFENNGKNGENGKNKVNWKIEKLSLYNINFKDNEENFGKIKIMTEKSKIEFKIPDNVSTTLKTQESWEGETELETQNLEKLILGEKINIIFEEEIEDSEGFLTTIDLNSMNPQTIDLNFGDFGPIKQGIPDGLGDADFDQKRRIVYIGIFVFFLLFSFFVFRYFREKLVRRIEEQERVFEI